MQFRNVVVGVDFTEPSLAAVRWVARHLAPEARLVLVHVLSETAVPPFLQPLLPSTRNGVNAAAAVLYGGLRGLANLIGSDRVRIVTVRGAAADAGRDRGNGAQGRSGAYDALVVDDDADSRRVAAKFLTQAGVNVREAQDRETALRDMRIRQPDVVVLDLMMPVLDGFGVLAAMRADPLLAAVPAVVLTAKSLTEAERHFLSRTAVRVLQKGEHRLGDVAALVLRAAARTG